MPPFIKGKFFDENTKKRCSQCGKEKYLDAFYRDKTAFLYRSKCIECDKKTNLSYRATPEGKANRKARNERYAIRHPERVKARRSKWEDKNRETLRAYHRQWEKDHPLSVNGYTSKKRAAKSGSEINDLKLSEWAWILQLFKYRCAYCGKKSKRLTQDHVSPLSLKGPHTMANIVPCCLSCNSKKRIGPPLCPVQSVLPLEV